MMRLADTICHPNRIPAEILGEVYLQVSRVLQNNLSAKPIRSPEAFAGYVAYRESRRVKGRERDQAAKHTPTGEDSARKLGQRLEIHKQPDAREPLDELVLQESCRRVRAFLEQLPERDRSLLLTSISDSLHGSTLDQLACGDKVSVRTMQRRRKALLDRLRQNLGGSP